MPSQFLQVFRPKVTLKLKGSYQELSLVFALSMRAFMPSSMRPICRTLARTGFIVSSNDLSTIFFKTIVSFIAIAKILSPFLSMQLFAASGDNYRSLRGNFSCSRFHFALTIYGVRIFLLKNYLNKLHNFKNVDLFDPVSLIL